MWRELSTLWQTLRDPEYAHLLLEPLPLYGIGLGLVFLFVAVSFHEGKCKALALLVICLSSASVWPCLSLREKAEPRIVAMRDPSYGPLIREQTKRRASLQLLYYCTAAFCGLAALLSAAGKGRGVLIIALIFAVAAFWASLWLHKKEAEIYHRNIIREPGRAGKSQAQKDQPHNFQASSNAQTPRTAAAVLFL